jgi:ribonuclease P protein component
MREAVRKRLSRLDRAWSIVFNPRRSVLDAPFPALEREVERLFERCNAR